MSIIFSPVQIGNFIVKNRLIRSATAERMFEADGCIRPELLDIYSDLTKGGTGLIISGHLTVSKMGKAHEEMGMLHKDPLITEWQKVTRLVHQDGAGIVAQLNHAGAKANGAGTEVLLAPSTIEARQGQKAARELTDDEIGQLVQDFVLAAIRAQKAGFDGVQIHSAHGYLGSQFLSPLYNRREDKWGGSIENRARFLMNTINAVRQTIGEDFLIGIKLGMIDGDPEGLQFSDAVEVVKMLNAVPLDFIEVSSGFGGKRIKSSRPAIRSSEEEAYFREYAREIKKITALPIALVGGLRSRSVMEDVLNSGDADFISICRPLINNPYFPVQLEKGELDVSGCIGGNRCWPKSEGVGIACRCGKENRGVS